MTARLTSTLLCVAFLFAADLSQAARVSDVRATKHNFSATAVGRTTGTQPTRTVKANTETEVCVFCHTPHGASSTAPTPLWNRSLNTTENAYTPYTSSTLDAEVLLGSALEQPGGSSKLCLSCHDGTLAIGNVNVLDGNKNVSISMTGAGGDGEMPGGAGATTGFTRRLGVNLTNDHPISVTYNTALATRDGELRSVDAQQRWPAGSGSVISVRSSGSKPAAPLEGTGAGGEGQIQCGTCHDPHLYETDTTKGPQKFLRLNRFQEAQPTGTFTQSTDIVCLSCHDKDNSNASWAYSAHANQVTADEAYKGTLGDATTAAGLREFPTSLPVWKAACLNCHDTHTVQGARRLLREGTDAVASPAFSAKVGGNPALEETCYQCHTTSAASVINAGNGTVPNIASDFGLSRHMPIKSSEQPGAQEQHDISGNFSDAGFIDCTGASSKCGRDFLESRTRLGVGALNNRHAECTDCHNPHRVIRARDGLPGALTQANTSTDTRAAHNHAAPHTNAISGALRGAWGVEPIYGGGSFFSLPSGYTVKRGDPGANTSSAASMTYVTREYQICLKCHSDYGYSDNNTFLATTANRPRMDSSTSLTGINPDGRNNFEHYTNQAREFQPNNAAGGTGADAAYSANNFRSWHPVIGATGRPLSSRGSANSSTWLAPWNNNVGTQTMYCSDCHGSVTSGATVDPGTSPWGPHGSANKFILKGDWAPGLGGPGRDTLGSTDTLCFKCHNRDTYTTRSNSGNSGFCCDGKGNLHNYHVDKVGKIFCSWCHVAVPHGWKNKALLVNLNDVGAEAGQTGSKEVATNANAANYSEGPYYMRAKNKVVTFRASGSWTAGSCGSSGKAAGDRIAASNGNTTNTTGTGIDWMKTTCSNPP